VEIFEDQEKRLDLAFAEEEPLDRLEDPLLALRRVKGVPRGIVNGDIQQRQKRRQERLQRPVRCEKFARQSFTDLPLVVPLLDPEILSSS
jgi:hypothetical protein